MAQQPGGEFASADAATRRQDAGVQERRIGAKISLSACRHSKYLLRPAPPHLSENAPSLQGVGDADVARSCRGGLMNQTSGVCYASIRQRDNARADLAQEMLFKTDLR